ncbi:MAG: hypothetical protein LBK72_10305 [Bifidobacteriaceae bacterium]|nr:hypothetical protein [Bifidobacteriaceae bacterium]
MSTLTNPPPHTGRAARWLIGVVAAVLSAPLAALPAKESASAAAPVDSCASQMQFQLPAPAFERLAGAPGTFLSLAYSQTEARTVTLEVSTGGAWAPVSSASIPAAAGAEWTPNDLPYPADLAQGTQRFRLTMASAGACVALQTDMFTITFRKATYTFGHTMTTVGGDKRTSASTRSPMTLVGSGQAEILGGPQFSDIVVERKAAGAEWTPMPGVKVEAVPDGEVPTFLRLEAKIPRLSASTKHKAAKVSYRFTSTESATVAATSAEPVTVGYFNSRAVLKAAVARDCPSTKVYFKKKLVGVPKEAVGAYQWNGNKIEFLMPAIDDRMSIEAVRAVAFHECGHHLQEVTYTNHRAAEKAAKKVFASHSKPFEHWADCIAYVRQPTENMGYGGTCTAKEIKAAKRTLKKKKLS